MELQDFTKQEQEMIKKGLTFSKLNDKETADKIIALIPQDMIKRIPFFVRKHAITRTVKRISLEYPELYAVAEQEGKLPEKEAQELRQILITIFQEKMNKHKIKEALCMNKKILATAVLGTGALSTLFAHQAEASTTHTVRSGESLWSISHHYGITVSKLKSLNGLSSNLIFPNQVLKVSGSSNYSSRSNYGNSSSTYTVRAGDSLSSIASRYGTTYRHIMNLNGLNSFLIFPGQQLKVSGSVSSNSHSSYNSNSGGSSSTYTVRYGDSLSSIASRYGTTYQHIMRLNGLNNFFIYPGQKLRVSGSASSNTYSTRSAQSTYYSSPVFNHRNLYDWGQCTWHVFNRRAAIGKGISTYWWNANNWDNAAARDGYRIDGNPTVGSIAQSDAGYYGHVAFVERVNSNGSILVSEMNFSASPGILTYRTIPAYQVRNYKFIH